MSCAFFDLPCHAQDWFWGLVNMVPWWAWIAIAVAVAGAAYRFGGWPAVAALMFGYGYLWAKRPSEREPVENLDPRSPDADRPIFGTRPKKPHIVPKHKPSATERITGEPD